MSQACQLGLFLLYSESATHELYKEQTTIVEEMRFCKEDRNLIKNLHKFKGW